MLGWLINHVRLKPSEWLASRCVAPEPCSPVLAAATTRRPASAAHNAGPPDSALRARDAVVSGMALTARRLLLYGARSPARAPALSVPSLSATAWPLARGSNAARGAASSPAAADVRRTCSWLASRTVVIVSGFAASASSAACAGAEAEGEDGTEDRAASGEEEMEAAAPSELGDADETAREGREDAEEVRART